MAYFKRFNSGNNESWDKSPQEQMPEIGNLAKAEFRWRGVGQIEETSYWFGFSLGAGVGFGVWTSALG